MPIHIKLMHLILASPVCALQNDSKYLSAVISLKRSRRIHPCRRNASRLRLSFPELALTLASLSSAPRCLCLGLSTFVLALSHDNGESPALVLSAPPPTTSPGRDMVDAGQHRYPGAGVLSDRTGLLLENTHVGPKGGESTQKAPSLYIQL
jgi:hypothetical protein